MRLMSSLQLKRAILIMRAHLTQKAHYGPNGLIGVTANCYTYKNRFWSVISYIWLKSARFGSPELTDGAP